MVTSIWLLTQKMLGHTKSMILGRTRKSKSGKFFLQIKLTGEKINLKKHNMFKEIKSATYHKLNIYKRNSVTYIKVYFDV